MRRTERRDAFRQLHEALGVEHGPVGLTQCAVRSGDDRHVRVAHEVDPVGGEDGIQRSQDREEEVVVQLVELHPLGEDATLCQKAPHARVELLREQAGRAAHPRVARLGEDDVEALALIGEVRLRVVEDVARPRIGERRIVRRQEDDRCLDHEGLDLDRHDTLELFAGQEGGGRHA